MKRVLQALAILQTMLLVASPANATAPDVTVEDLQAVVRSLGFLETLPRDGTIAIAIVYSQNQPEGEALAKQTAQRLAAMPGPNSSVFQPAILPASALARRDGRLDVALLMPGTSADAAAIIDAVRSRRIVSISVDPICLDAKYCVLMVRAERRVEIVLDTALAEQAGARFSSVFLMMVKRK
jgi:hypothetical protein